MAEGPASFQGNAGYHGQLTEAKEPRLFEAPLSSP